MGVLFCSDDCGGVHSGGGDSADCLSGRLLVHSR